MELWRRGRSFFDARQSAERCAKRSARTAPGVPRRSPRERGQFRGQTSGCARIWRPSPPPKKIWFTFTDATCQNVCTGHNTSHPEPTKKQVPGALYQTFPSFLRRWDRRVFN